jgi:catechol 2,3-dioxygenase-like lactoylglutathione lyase family enzyme
MIQRIHSISLRVPDLAHCLAYYTQTTGFAEVQRFTVPANDSRGVAEQRVLLDAQTAYLELIGTPSNGTASVEPAVYTAGITHVCYQAPATQPAYPRFQNGQTRFVSRGNQPIDLAGQGITYAYARDVAGNLFELEQLAAPPRSEALWLGHVALVTPHLERLIHFYAVILLGLPQAPPSVRFANNPKLDAVADLDQVDLSGAWIRAFSVHLEFWQYHHPATPPLPALRSQPQYGYTSITFETDDLLAEYERLQKQAVQFAAPPQPVADVWQVVGYDPDGNLFQLQQMVV